MKNTDALPKIAKAEDSEKCVIKKKITTRDLEIWECAQLSSNFESTSKPSDVFRKLEERRKERHENRMKQLAKDLNEINLKTESNIKMSSIEVKAHMKYFSDQLNEILINIDKPEVASYCNSVFLDFQNKANEFKTQQQKLINELYDDLIKFENNRTEENEKVFHVACEEIRKIGYFLPYELQTFIEHKVMEMNQLVLNNRRCYCDLKLTLTLVTEETFKTFIDKVFCIREKWVQYKIQEAFFNIQNDTEKKIARLSSEEYCRLEVKGLELTVKLSPDNLYSTCRTEEWSKNVIKVLGMIETHGKNIIELYRKTLDAVFRSFDNKVEEIKKELNSIEVLTIEERVIKPILFEAKSDQWKEIENLEIFWQETLDDIKSTLQEVTEFLMDAGKLWDRHTERLCESKKLILRALEKAEESNQILFQDLEVKLNIALDSLRQEHVKSKLDKAHEAVVAILNLIKAKYESSYVRDVTIVEDYYKMMALEADVLSAELKEFIYVSHILTNIRTGPNMCEQYRSLPERKLVCKEIQICAHKIKAVKSWKSGVWIAMENLALKTRESLEPRAEAWVQRKIDGLAEKMSIQMELLEKRFKRIKIEFYEKRSEEIDYHQSVYDQHREGVKAVYQTMKEDLANLIERESKKLSEIEKNFQDIEESVKSESCPRVVLSNKILIQRKQDETQNDLKDIFERFRVDCEIKMTDLRQSNVNFMKDIKLFHEDGNYSAEEGKMFVTLLESIDKEISAELKNIVKDVAKEESELLRKCSLAFTPIINLLSLVYEETIFIHDIRERLKNIAEDIRQLADRLKLDFKILKDQANCFCECYDSDEFLNENQQRLWFVLFDSVYKNVSNLFYPVKLPVTPVQSAEEVGEYSSLGETGAMTPCFGLAMFSTKVTVSTTPTFRTHEVEKKLSCKDFKGLLFGGEDPPENDGSFMAIISNRLWIEMDILQKAACNFYKKVEGSGLIKEDLIPASYDTFADEVLTKFRFYNVQCEQLWLRLILDFLPILAQIKWTVHQFLERVIKKYEETMLTTLKMYQEDFASRLEGQSSKTRELFDELDNKLMPLHGYSQNKGLLDELEEEVVERTAGLGVEWETAIKKFKNQLKNFRCYHLKNRIEVNKIQILFNKMKEKIFVEYLGSSLLDTIGEWTTRGGYLTFRSSKESFMKDEGENSLASGSVPDNYKLYLNSVDGKLHSVQTYLKYLKDFVELERSKASNTTLSCLEDLNGNAEGFRTEGIKPQLNVLLKLPDFEEWMAKVLEKAERELKLLKTFAESKENVHEEALFKWLNVWKFNVNKVRKLYSVRYEERPKSPEKVTTAERKEKKRMADSENNNKPPKIKKTSDSVTSTLPRLCPTTKHDTKDISYNIPKLESRSLGSRPISDENKKRPGLIKHSKTNLQKSKLTETKSSGESRFKSNVSLTFISHCDYRGRIPVPYKYSVNLLEMSLPITRSSSPSKKSSPKEKTTTAAAAATTNKVKTITFDQNTKKKNRTGCSRSPSPAKKIPTQGNYKKPKPRPASPIGSSKAVEKSSTTLKRIEGTKQERISPRLNSPTRRKSKTKVPSASNIEVYSKSKASKEANRPIGNAEPLVLKQTSQPSLCKNDLRIQPQEKISLDHLKNEVFLGDHKRLSIEEVHLCIEKSLENGNVGGSTRSYVVTYSSEDLSNSMSFLQSLSNTSIKTYKNEPIEETSEERTDSKSAIRTLSGHELVLTPSMKLEMEKSDVECDDLEIAELLHETVEDLEEPKEIQILQDDANEYDSEMSTEEDALEEEKTGNEIEARKAVSKCNDLQKKSSHSLWRKREAELLNDVDYRQSVYHPAISRRHKEDHRDKDFRPKSRSIEDNYGYANKTTDRIVRSLSSNLRHTYSPQTFTVDKIDGTDSKQSWGSMLNKDEGKTIYNPIIHDVPIYTSLKGMKRIRTKKERISGALLRITLKIIRLLAIFNLWPGDNCYMMTSQSLRLAR